MTLALGVKSLCMSVHLCDSISTVQAIMAWNPYFCSYCY